MPLKELHKELFHPTGQDNKDSTQMLEKLGVVAVTRWLVELIDPTNATYPLNHWCQNLKERIGMANPAAISDMAQNGFLEPPTMKKEMGGKKTSLFHGLPEEL